jgi:HK97 family phage prohead protease
MREIRSNRVNITLNDRIVEGYALVFDSKSEDLGGFTEVIDARSLEGVIDLSDVLCLLNHNMDRGVLARRNKGQGSLTLEVDSVGLKYRFDAPQTAVGDELLEGLRRGDITGSSFAFSVENEKWSKESNGRFLRRIVKFKELYDVSPVYRPAYEDTTVYIDRRGLDSILAAEKIPCKGYYEKMRKKFRV